MPGAGRRLTGRQVSVLRGLLERMDLARWLTAIDRLRVREFPETPTRSAFGSSAPGHHVAVLDLSGDFFGVDPAWRTEIGEQFEAAREALAALLAERWGPPQHVSLYRVFEQTMIGEDTEEPWSGLSARMSDVLLWPCPDTGRWIALGISQWGPELPYELLVVIAEAPP
jgi:hypothetical protein